VEHILPFIAQGGSCRVTKSESMLCRVGSHKRILIVFLLLSALAGALLMFASEVMEGETLAFDRWILLAMRSPTDPAIPAGPAWLRLSMADVTALGGYTVLTMLTGFAVVYLIIVRKAVTALFLAGSVISGLLMSSILKFVYLRPRPELVAHLVPVQTSSFPSGHATNAAVVYLTLAILLANAEKNRWVRSYLMAIAIFLTVAVGVSRVYLGVHWPSDVLAGWCVGGAWAGLCSFVTSEIRHRSQISSG
jgi:undecaprenyl-diphosphatase